MKKNIGLLPWINQQRLRDYPRLMLITTWVILAANILLRNGWQGGLGQIIGGDFIMFYSTGQLYAENPSLIYNYDQQAQLQQSLVSPTILPGLNPFMNPPYVAPIYRLLNILPLPSAFIAWTVLMIAFALITVFILVRIIPAEIAAQGLNRTQLLVLVLSFFPFIESLQAGQNSGLTLLLMTCLVYFTYKEQHFLAGTCAGLMIYKPQYVIGFLILWVVWKNIKSLSGFAIVALLWIGLFYNANGLSLFREYQSLSQVFVLLPYMRGFPAYILVTFYGLLTTLLPESTQAYSYYLSQALLVFSVIALAYYAFRIRLQPTLDRTPAIIMAILLPLLATPYALLHDLVILIPAFILWARYQPSRKLLIIAIVIYFGTFFLTLIGALTHIALNALLVISLVVLVMKWLVKKIPRTANLLG